MTKNEYVQFRLLVIIILTLLAFAARGLYIMINHEPIGKRVEISETLGFFRADLEKILSEKIIKYAKMDNEKKREVLSEEIDNLFKLLDSPDQKSLLVYFYSPKGEAKSFSDEVSTVVIKSDSGWELATITFAGDGK